MISFKASKSSNCECIRCNIDGFRIDTNTRLCFDCFCTAYDEFIDLINSDPDFNYTEKNKEFRAWLSDLHQITYLDS